MGLLVSRPIPSSKQQVNVIDEELRRLFEALDANRDGLLSNDELVALFKENGQPFVSSQSVGSLMARYTLKKEFPPDMWTFEEFCKVFKTALTLFHEIDSDANGFIDVDELEIALVLNNDMGPLDTNVSALIQRFDVSRDGRLDFAEFFFLYDMSAREKLADLLSFWTHSMISWSDSPLVVMPNNLVGSLLCGGISGAVGRTLTAPLSRLLTMSQTNITGGESLAAMSKRIINKEGIKGFWRGNGVTLLKIAPSVAMNLVIFERLQAWMKERNFGGSHAVRDILAGAVAGTIGTVVTFPLDTLKTKMQAEGNPNKSMLQTMGEFSSVRSVFRGVNLAILEIAPQTGLRFYLMMRTKEALFDRMHQPKSSYPAIIASSMIAGVISQGLTYPLGLLRRVQQTTNLSAWECAQRVWNAGGFRGFFRGLPLNVAQIVPSVALSFAVYEGTKDYFQK